MAQAFFQIPLNLPHAALVSMRILYHLRQGDPSPAAVEAAAKIAMLLEPWRDLVDNGPDEDARRAALEAAVLGRALVDGIERAAAGTDRLGQQVRNLFECLELGEEGARLSLRAGENPNSLLRPK